jgi:hypothetical protein
LDELCATEIDENWPLKPVAPHDVARLYVAVHDSQSVHLFQGFPEVLFVIDRMTQRRAHLHREFNASASEDQVKPEDFLDFWANFKC